MSFSLFFFNDTATTEIYTLSLHDALPIYRPIYFVDLRTEYACSWCEIIDGKLLLIAHPLSPIKTRSFAFPKDAEIDRKSTRLNSSHQIISYAVFCLKKKKKNSRTDTRYHA